MLSQNKLTGSMAQLIRFFMMPRRAWLAAQGGVMSYSSRWHLRERGGGGHGEKGASMTF